MVFLYVNDIRDEVNQAYGESYHEGDWEHIQIRLTEENGTYIPDLIEFHAHYGGATFAASECYWSPTNEPQFHPPNIGYSPSNTHIHVWIAQNAHASYNLFQPVSYTMVSDIIAYYYEDVDYSWDCPTFWEYSQTLVKMGEVRDQTINGSDVGYHGDNNYSWDTHFTPIGDSQEFLAFQGHFGDDWFTSIFQDTPSPESPAKHIGWKSFNTEAGHWGEWSEYQGWTEEMVSYS